MHSSLFYRAEICLFARERYYTSDDAGGQRGYVLSCRRLPRVAQIVSLDWTSRTARNAGETPALQDSAANFTRLCLGFEVAIRARRNIRVPTPGRIEVF